jgi:hypothetical protein
MVLGPPKSKAGRRVVGIPAVIIPVLRGHLAAFVKEEPGALVFPGQVGGPLRRGNFNKMSDWPHAARAIGMEGLHFHDLSAWLLDNDQLDLGTRTAGARRAHT